MSFTDKLGEYNVKLQQFSSNQYVQGSKDFLKSNLLGYHLAISIQAR